MAKRPRMGRNLDALLGGGARERSSRSSDASASRSDGLTAPETLSSADEAPVDEAAAGETASTTDHPAVDDGSTRPVASQSFGEAAPEPFTAVTGKASDAAVDVAHRADGATTHAAGTAAAEAGNQAVSEAVSEAVRATVASANGRVPPAAGSSGTTDRLRMIGVEQISRGSYQPRRLFDQELLQELADSIRAEGLIQPIIVRPCSGGFELVAGERRWRAAQLAGIAEIPAIVRDMQDKSVAAVSLIENIQRKDLNPLEEAAAFERLCDEFGMTHKAVAESVGRSRASVTNLMRLLELHDEVKSMVDRGELEMGHARALLGAPRERQPTLARDVIRRGLTVRAVEKLVRTLAQGETPSTGKSGPVVDPDIERLSQKLGETLGAAVRIQHQTTGRGKLEISYSSVAELQGILAHIR